MNFGLCANMSGFCSDSHILLITLDYNLLTHCPKVIILVPKDPSLQELFSGIISFDMSRILAKMSLLKSYKHEMVKEQK